MSWLVLFLNREGFCRFYGFKSYSRALHRADELRAEGLRCVVLPSYLLYDLCFTGKHLFDYE